MATTRRLTECRLCLKTCSLSEITVLNNNEHLIKSIFLITSIDLLNLITNAKLGTKKLVHICSKCQSTLNQCIDFRKYCIQNDATLRARLNEEAKFPETQWQRVHVFLQDINENSSRSKCTTPLSDDCNDSPANSDGSQSDSSDDEPSPNGGQKRNGSSTDPDENEVSTSGNVGDREIALLQLQNIAKGLQRIPREKQIRPKKPLKKAEKLAPKLAPDGPRSFQCDLCSKVYATRWGFKVHFERKHSDGSSISNKKKCVDTTEKRWQCEYCAKTFRFKNDLTVHTRIHTGEKPYCCDICGKRFNKSSNVNNHKKSHRGSGRGRPKKKSEEAAG